MPQPSSATRGCRSWPSGVCSPSSCSLAFRRMQCCWEPLLFLPALDTLKLYIADDRGTGSGGCSCAATRVATRAAGSPCLVSETRAGWPSQRLSQRRPRPCSTPRFSSLRRSLATSVSHSERRRPLSRSRGQRFSEHAASRMAVARGPSQSQTASRARASQKSWAAGADGAGSRAERRVVRKDAPARTTRAT